jgi:hypothetical protein
MERVFMHDISYWLRANKAAADFLSWGASTSIRWVRRKRRAIRAAYMLCKPQL